MQRTQRLQLKQSDLKQELGDLLDLETRSDEQEARRAELTREIRSLEADINDARLAEPDTTTIATPTGEDRERLELRSRFRVGRVLGAMVGKNPLNGVEAEYMAAVGTTGGAVPVDVFETREAAPNLEQRAVTPGVEGGTNQRPIVPALFKRTILDFCRVEMPNAGIGDVAFPVLSTSVTADTKGKDADLPQTAGAFTVSTQQPRRLGASFLVRYEDLARLEGMESALRRNIMDAVADKIDDRFLNGAAAAYNTDGEIRGLLAQLTDASAPATGQETWARYHTAAVSHLKDPYAIDETGIRMLLGEATYRHAAGKFRANESSESFTSYWNRVGGGVRMSGHMPAAASNVQQALVIRANPAMDAACVMPHWGAFDLTIRDIYTKAKAGQVEVTVHVLCGDPVLLRSDVYQQDSFRIG